MLVALKTGMCVSAGTRKRKSKFKEFRRLTKMDTRACFQRFYQRQDPNVRGDLIFDDKARELSLEIHNLGGSNRKVKKKVLLKTEFLPGLF
jgi:hypothetical protein